MKRIIVLIFLVLPWALYAQTDAQFTQFHNARLFYNPASINGQDALLNISVLDREQWLGYAGRPAYRMLNASYSFEDKNMGVGLTVYDQLQNVEHVFNAKASYAYQVRVGFDAYISMGISVGFIGRYLSNLQTADDIVSVTQENYNNIDLGLGVEFVNSNIVTGISVTHLPVAIGKQAYKATPHFYGYFTYNFFLTDEWVLAPSLILRNSIYATNLDINLQVKYLGIFSAGVGYRLDALTLMAGVNLGKNFILSYSFDMNLGGIRTESNKGHLKPSHEFGLLYRGFLTDIWIK
ncbi:MAG: PorP/SprF family type IX secretion system membrane protein [Bacteroidales bacterium]